MQSRMGDNSQLSIRLMVPSDSTISIWKENFFAGEESDSKKEKFDQPNLLVGAQGRNNFMELFKSERKLKDFNERHDVTKDPRFTYFEQCKQYNMIPVLK